MKDKYRQEVKRLSAEIKKRVGEWRRQNEQWLEDITSTTYPPTAKKEETKPVSLGTICKEYLDHVGRTVLALERITEKEEISLQKAKAAYEQAKRENWDYPTLMTYMKETYGITKDIDTSKLTPVQAEKNRKDLLTIMHDSIEAQKGIINISNVIAKEGWALYKAGLKQHYILTLGTAEIAAGVISGIYEGKSTPIHGALEEVKKAIEDTRKQVDDMDEETIRRALKQQAKKPKK